MSLEIIFFSKKKQKLFIFDFFSSLSTFYQVLILRGHILGYWCLKELQLNIY